MLRRLGIAPARAGYSFLRARPQKIKYRYDFVYSNCTILNHQKRPLTLKIARGTELFLPLESNPLKLQLPYATQFLEQQDDGVLEHPVSIAVPVHSGVLQIDQLLNIAILTEAPSGVHVVFGQCLPLLHVIPVHRHQESQIG